MGSKCRKFKQYNQINLGDIEVQNFKYAKDYIVGILPNIKSGKPHYSHLSGRLILTDALKDFLDIVGKSKVYIATFGINQDSLDTLKELVSTVKAQSVDICLSNGSYAQDNPKLVSLLESIEDHSNIRLAQFDIHSKFVIVDTGSHIYHLLFMKYMGSKNRIAKYILPIRGYSNDNMPPLCNNTTQ